MDRIVTAGNNTLKFYNENACVYALRTPGRRHLVKREKFIAMLPPHALVLDLGCGAGHDSEAFLKAGLHLELLDFSWALAAECEKRTNQTVRIEKMEDLNDEFAFDAVWASASLLHLNSGNLENVFFRIFRSLRNGGLFMCSFKEGEVDWIDEHGRSFVAMSETRLVKLAKVAGFEIVDVHRSEPDSDSRSDAVWLWLCGRKG